ncbi:MAG: hypothetical protein IPK32_21515 [Verrucomicrobiaceae bacterium]|nr:hypothetical protein [Verrucomicrobiaceae bacterium]
MSRHHQDIDLHALPTVADHDDDDLIDRDDRWHEHQRQKEQEKATAAVPTPHEQPTAHPEPQPEIAPEPYFEPEAENEPQETPLENPAESALEPEIVQIDEIPPVVAPAHSEPQIEPPEAQSPPEEPQADEPPHEDSHPIDVPKPPPEPELSEEQKKHVFWLTWKEKIGANSLAASIIIHLPLVAIEAFITVRHVMNKQVDFLPGGNAAGAAASNALEQRVKQKRQTWTRKQPPLRRISVQSIASDIQLPEMQMDNIDLSDMTDKLALGNVGAITAGLGGGGLGGAGGGFGAGIGRGGAFNFLGQTAFGKRVVFVVDVSGSMEAVGEGGTSRIQALKRELDKSLAKIPAGTFYQILCFSDFAWPHNIVDPSKSAAFEKYRWPIAPEDWKSARIPSFPFLQATVFNINDSRKNIAQMSTNGGTNWGSGLLMALKANPRPDIIFFMTDGQRIDEMGWIDIITQENHRMGTGTIIHTSVMMETDAAADMDRLARSNGGTFSVVLKDGTVMRGDKYFSK